MRTISSKADVTHLVEVFYERVRDHDTLATIFNDKIGKLWFLHKDTLSRFWETLLLDNRTYHGTPLPKHLDIPIKAEHFAMWLEAI